MVEKKRSIPSERDMKIYEDAVKLMREENLSQAAALRKLKYSTAQYYRAKNHVLGLKKPNPTLKRKVSKDLIKKILDQPSSSVFDVRVPLREDSSKVIVLICEPSNLKNIISNFI